MKGISYADLDAQRCRHLHTSVTGMPHAFLFAMELTNAQRFQAALEQAYARLFETDADFQWVSTRKTPAELAALMTEGLCKGSANHDGKGIRLACKAVGIKPTLKAITAFLNA